MCAALPRLPPTVEISPGGADTPGGGCTPTRQYTPSAWEREWRLNISTFADSIMWKRGCEQLKRQEPSVKAWLASWSQHETGVKGDLDAALFSYHTLHTCVNGETRSVRVPIEPLVGLLRHPKYYCLVSGKVPPTLLQGTFSSIIVTTSCRSGAKRRCQGQAAARTSSISEHHCTPPALVERAKSGLLTRTLSVASISTGSLLGSARTTLTKPSYPT